MTQAPIFEVYHSRQGFTSDTVFTFAKNLLAKQYPVGAATVAVPNTREVEGHAYSILEAIEVTLDNGSTEKLFKMYNPWNEDYWKGNPWGDTGYMWTENLKKQVNYINNLKDGLFYTSTKDFLTNFGASNWAEVDQNYDIVYQDISMNQKADKNYPVKFDTQFTLKNNGGKTIYIFVDSTDERLQNKCGQPYYVFTLKVVGPNGVTYESSDFKDGITLKIENPKDGLFTVTASIIKYQDYALYFTITSYATINTVEFLPKANNEILVPNKIDCINGCNGKGRCNLFEGKCNCDFPFGGKNCERKDDCPDNCGGNGVCNRATGIKIN